MNKTILIIGGILATITLFAGGVFFGQVFAQSEQANWMMNGTASDFQSGNNMMGNNAYGAGMMNGAGMMGNTGMMGGQAGDMMGMMAGFSGLSDKEPLTIEESETAVSDYLITLNQDNLALGEIMIFSNNAYAQILNSETGEGVFEVLVDPSTGKVFPEPGPNMMWNTEFGMMAGSGMMNMMMGDNAGMMSGQNGNMMDGSGIMNGQNGNMMGNSNTSNSAEITVTAEDAPSIAQTYLDSALPGTTVDEHADTFPGYYTLHIERDGDVIGMLSVNAYTGDVFLHHWHGDFIEMVDEH